MTEPDGTLGGYVDKHGRPPAFEGSDGAFYSVDVFEDEDGASLLFVRWSDDGAQPVGHVESPVLANVGEGDAKTRVLARSLVEVKHQLDQAIEARRQLPDW